jgi:hypothetical protein
MADRNIARKLIDFVADVASSKQTPFVPEHVRDRAAVLLRELLDYCDSQQQKERIET